LKFLHVVTLKVATPSALRPSLWKADLTRQIAVRVTASFPSTFEYWTDPLETTPFSIPVMVDQQGKIHPALWVPFTRAGCDVGAFSVANIEFENITTDVTNVFGAGSPEAAEATSNPTKAKADFLGIAVHCAQNSPICTKGKPDVLTDEPGG
jgi:hypothetical protein